jgi:hypothetical protein
MAPCIRFCLVPSLLFSSVRSLSVLATRVMIHIMTSILNITSLVGATYLNTYADVL